MFGTDCFLKVNQWNRKLDTITGETEARHGTWQALTVDENLMVVWKFGKVKSCVESGGLHTLW